MTNKPVITEPNDEDVRLTKGQIIAFIAIMLAMFGSLVYGYFLYKADTPKNCWDKYTTEDLAIINCEGVNK